MSDRFSLAVVLCVIVWIGYVLACALIQLCRWAYGRWQTRRAGRRVICQAMTPWERVQARRTARSRFRSGSMLILFLLLAGCGTAPVQVTRTPDVCPALPATPAQAKKVLAPALPTLDETEMASGDKHRIASEILRVRVDSAAQYQACRANNDALETWALSHSQP
jgi:hypothetical protein